MDLKQEVLGFGEPAIYTIINSIKLKELELLDVSHGYCCQFLINHARVEKREPINTTTGLDVGLNHFYTDSNGKTVDNPRYLRKSERQLKRLQKRVSKKFLKGQPQSNNYKKAKQILARKHLQVSRQRKDFAVKTALCVVRSNDLVAYVGASLPTLGGIDLKVKNMVKNHQLAVLKSLAGRQTDTCHPRAGGDNFPQVYK